MPYLTSTARASYIMPYLTSPARAPTSCTTSPILQEIPHRALLHQYCKSYHIVPYLTSTAARASHIMPYLTSPARAPTSCPTSPILQELPHHALPHQSCKSYHIMPVLQELPHHRRATRLRSEELCVCDAKNHCIYELENFYVCVCFENQ